MPRRHLEAAIWAAVAVLLAIVGTGAYMKATEPAAAATAPQAAFATAPSDRPLLESVESVEIARRTGTGMFRIGSEHYAVRGLPREYVDYSSWRVRMP